MEKPRTERHLFIRNHWKPIVSIWVIIFVGSITTALKSLTKEQFIGGLWIVLLVNIYFLTLRFSKKAPILGRLKEILTGTLFTLGVSYFSLLHDSLPNREILIYQCAFGLLCFTNVLLISHWEFKIDQEQDEANLTQRGRNNSILFQTALATCLAGGVILSLDDLNLFASAVLLSTIALGFLNLFIKRNGTDTLKPLIDVPLMLPFLLFFIF